MSKPPPLRDVIEAHGLGAKKALGQHFLLDLNITAKIARAGGVAPGDRVLEIGPGPGGLTRALLDAGAAVVCIERDARCIGALEELGRFFPGQLSIVEGDALHTDEMTLPALSPPVKIIANLPYNISTELLIKWIKAGAALWSQMTLMFQKEVADRILAAPGSKTYGRLSVMAQAGTQPKRAFDLPPQAFTPPPKVASSVVTFDPPAAAPGDLAALERITAAAFGQRRKMVRTSLKPIFGTALEERLSHADIAPTTRAEDISVAQYLVLAAAMAH